MGTRSDAAQAEVIAARSGLDEELVRLEAAGRAAVDIPARIRRAPAQTLGVAAGAGFLLLGGPRRLFRRLRRAVVGPAGDLPPSLLPDAIEKAVRNLGADGERVRGTIEREFERYLEERSPERRSRDFMETATSVLGNVLRPASVRAGKRLAERLFDPDAQSFSEGLRKARERTKRG